MDVKWHARALVDRRIKFGVIGGGGQAEIDEADHEIATTTVSSKRRPRDAWIVVHSNTRWRAARRGEREKSLPTPKRQDPAQVNPGGGN